MKNCTRLLRVFAAAAALMAVTVFSACELFDEMLNVPEAAEQEWTLKNSSRYQLSVWCEDSSYTLESKKSVKRATAPAGLDWDIQDIPEDKSKDNLVNMEINPDTRQYIWKDKYVEISIHT